MTKICYKNANPICKGIESGGENSRISVIGFQIECLFRTNNTRNQKKGKPKKRAAKTMESGTETVENMQIAVGS